MTMITASNVGAHLRDQLRRAVDEMSSFGPSGAGVLRPLHQLQKWCDATLAGGDGEDLSVVPLYLLSRLLEDTLDNLTGDFRYDTDAHRLRTEFFSSLRDSLGHLATQPFELGGDWVVVLQQAIQSYIDLINQLNSRAVAQLTSESGGER